MRILGQIAEIGEDAVAPIFRIENVFVAKHVNEPRLAEFGGAIAFAMAIGGGDE